MTTADQTDCAGSAINQQGAAAEGSASSPSTGGTKVCEHSMLKVLFSKCSHVMIQSAGLSNEQHNLLYEHHIVEYNLECLKS